MRNTRSLARTIGVAAAALVIPLVLGSTVVASSSPMTPRTQQISSAPLRLGIINPNGPSATWELEQIESVLGERASLAVIYKDFAQPAPIAELDAADARGSTTLLTWEPWAAGAGVVQPEFPVLGHHRGPVRRLHHRMGSGAGKLGQTGDASVRARDERQLVSVGRSGQRQHRR
ncbi:MAG: hypothetical protein U5N21_10620 [Rhodococcus sp. (in: high G+C Gram-positive bacteria)]|nr:hypothetical protein [Rhodococcus sp. (in: high G+C Gram-positive bacteria)]